MKLLTRPAAFDRTDFLAEYRGGVGGDQRLEGEVHLVCIVMLIHIVSLYVDTG